MTLVLGATTTAAGAGPDDATPSPARPPRRRPGPRLASYALTVWFLVTLNFFLPRAMPGDPISTMLAAGGRTSALGPDQRAALSHYYGLDRPLLSQYGRYLKALARGDLGISISRGASVAGLLRQRLPWTLLLMGSACVVAAALGIAAGAHSGWRRGRAGDHGTLAFFVGLGNVPPFFLASVALYAFGVALGWVPLSGATTPLSSLRGLAAVADVAHHLVLPAVVLALPLAVDQYLVMRAGMVGQLGSDHLLLGRAKGLSPRRLKYRYAARNALLPVVSVSALHLGTALSGAIFVETVFAYPGLGRLLFEAVGGRDYPTLQGCFLVLSVLVLTANLAADLVYARLDPRARG